MECVRACVRACVRVRECVYVYPHTRIIIVMALVQINDYRTLRDFGVDRCMVYLTRI